MADWIGILGSFTRRLGTENSCDSSRADSQLSTEYLAACDEELGYAPPRRRLSPHKDTYLFGVPAFCWYIAGRSAPRPTMLRYASNNTLQLYPPSNPGWVVPTVYKDGLGKRLSPLTSPFARVKPASPDIFFMVGGTPRFHPVVRLT